MKKSDKVLILAGLIGPIYLFFFFLILGMFVPGYNPFVDYISELGAVDSPVRWIANIFGFIPMGAVMFLFGLGLYRVLEHKVSAKTGSLLLMVAGVLLSAVSAFPCDDACENTSVVGTMHEILSDAPLYLALIALFFFAAYCGKGVPFSLGWGIGFFVVGLLAGVFGYIYIHLDFFYGATFQRLSIWIPYFFMSVASWHIYRELQK
ncbi:DUF998 domain-containing protein [Candidatus Woesearchaeota archaeon]|nr:DUF998 domain-containing protein [Candidatus Woesearchaeota archaeon]